MLKSDAVVGPGFSQAWRSGRTAIVATLFFTLLTLVLTWPLPRVLATGIPGDFGDPLFISWVMTWVAGKLSAALANPLALRGLWDAPIFHPEPGALALSEHFIPQTVLILPIYWLTGNPILCYNVAFLSSYVLTGAGTALLARALSGSLAAALLAGVVAAFNEYRLVWEVAHLQTLSIYWFPFVLFGVEQYLSTGRRGGLAIAALSWIALNLSSVYYLAYCAPFIVLFVLVEAARHGRLRDARTWRDLAIAGAAVAALTAPFLVPYVDMQRRMGFARTALEVVTHSATLDNYRVALPRLAVPVALSLVALLVVPARSIAPRLRSRAAGPAPGPRTGVVVLIGASAVAAVWLSLGPIVQSGGQPTDLPAIYPLLAPLPGYSGLRVPARLASIFLVFLGVLAGLGVDVMSRRRAVAGGLAAVAIGIFLWQGRAQRIPLDQPLDSTGLVRAPAYLQPSPVLPPIYQAVAGLPPTAVLVEFPFGDPWYDVRYMFFAASHRRPLLNGYSGVFPATYRARQQTLWRPIRDPARAHESLFGATHAIVHTAAWPDRYGHQISEWLENTEGARLVADIDGARLYRLK